MKVNAALAAGLVCLTAQYVSATTEQIKWVECKQNASIPIECGTLTVPLDYTNVSSSETLNLDIVRVNGKEPKRGSIIFNPGGPGEPGRDTITGLAGYDLLSLTGGHFDLISFDPRGTGRTIPFSCANDSLTKAFRVERQFERLPYDLIKSEAALEDAMAVYEEKAKECASTQKAHGDLVGTKFVARDLTRIVDALGGDGLLNYWGFSYGTIIGTTVATMFPDRMGKLVLDGVVNPTEWGSGRFLESLTSTEDTFSRFFEGCVHDPDDLCELNDGVSALELHEDVDNFLLNLARTASNPEAGHLRYKKLRQQIFQQLYFPHRWSGLATTLNEAMYNESTADWESLAAVSKRSSFRVYPSLGTDAGSGIRCSNSALRTTNKDTLMAIAKDLKALSPTFGDLEALSVITCSAWPFRAKERYEFATQIIKTANPLLFIGNTFDPITPLVSAKNASASFAGSAVLHSDTTGHTSMSQPSLCTARAIRAYFTNGTLPANGAICEPSLPLFHTSKQAHELYAKLAEDGEVDEDDIHLLASMSRLGERLLQRVRYV